MKVKQEPGEGCIYVCVCVCGQPAEVIKTSHTRVNYWSRCLFGSAESKGLRKRETLHTFFKLQCFIIPLHAHSHLTDQRVSASLKDVAYLSIFLSTILLFLDKLG